MYTAAQMAPSATEKPQHSRKSVADTAPTRESAVPNTELKVASNMKILSLGEYSSKKWTKKPRVSPQPPPKPYFKGAIPVASPKITGKARITRSFCSPERGPAAHSAHFCPFFPIVPTVSELVSAPVLGERCRVDAMGREHRHEPGRIGAGALNFQDGLVRGDNRQPGGLRLVTVEIHQPIR